MTDVKLDLTIHSYLVTLPEPILDIQSVEIRKIHQRDGSWLWFVRQSHLVEGPVLNRLLEWEYNSLPSSRDADELDRTRYVSLDEAMTYVWKWAVVEYEKTKAGV